MYIDWLTWMRNLAELKMNEGPRPITAGEHVSRSPPTEEQIRAFEAEFGVSLPADYVSFLRFANGGHPHLCFFAAEAWYGADEFIVNVFYHLNDDREDLRGVWAATRVWRDAFNFDLVAIGNEPCGNAILLCFNTDPPNIKFCLHEGMSVIELAPSFGAFIDMLSAEPD